MTGFGATSVMGLLPFLGPFAGAGLTVGASAPLFGLCGALILYGQRTGSTAMGQEVWRWVIIFVVIGLIVPFIDNWAHLGGALGGLVARSWGAPGIFGASAALLTIWLLLAWGMRPDTSAR